jgi:putative ABC transport system permease protein
MVRNYIKIAFRNLIKNKVYSLINIVGLSIGLSAAILILLYVKDEVSYDRFHTKSPNIYRVVSDWYHPDGSIGHHDGLSSNLQGPIFKEKIPEIEAFVRYSSVFRDIRAKGEVKGYEMNYADSNFFSFFDFPMLAGNPKTALAKPNSVVISEEIALKLFNSVEVIGKTIDISADNKFSPYLITGVTQKCPQNSSIKFDFLLPKFVNREETAGSESWFNFSYHTFVLLNPKANIAHVVSKMKQINATDAAQANKIIVEKYEIRDKIVFNLQRLQDIHLSNDLPAQYGLLEASNPTYGYILSVIALFILLIACINFVNLTVARSLKRAKEIGVRKVVGSSRKQLIWQFMGESFLLSFIAFALAVLLVQLVLPTFNQLANKSLSISYLFDAKLLLGYFLIFVVTSFLAGFYPALVLSGYSPIKTLYGRFNFSGKNYLQKSLVVLQFSLASFLIIISFSFYSQFNFLTNKDLGYDDSLVIMVEKWDLTKQNADVFKASLLKNQNVLQVAPKNGENWEDVGKINGEQKVNFGLAIIDEEFLPLYKIPLVAGRNFSKDFPADSAKSVLVNEAFVKKANWKNPLGQTIMYPFGNPRKYQVVGVVKDYHYQSLTTEIKPQLLMLQSTGFGFLNIKIKPNTETASIVFIEKAFKKLFPMNAFVYKFKDLVNKKAYESEEKWKQIMLLGAILTIFISCIGLFGLATLSAEKRTKEIGIRKVLGASIANVVTLLSTDFIKLVSLSFIFSFPAAYYATQKWLENYPYRENFNWWIFAFTAAITICVALITVGWQSIRAALMNPVESLKTE